LLATALVAYQTDTAQPVALVVRASPAQGAIHVDGRLDEPSWLLADSALTLTQVEPHEGSAPTFRTVVRVLVRRDALVIGVVAEDSQPQAIVSVTKQRDADLTREDHIRLVLDTFRDGRSGYVFAVSASGARYDALVGTQGGGENANWDAVWTAATARSRTTWSVEILIPVKSLLFRPGLSAWGFNVERRIQRLQETDRWASAAQNIQLTQTSRAGLLTELPRFELGLGLNVRPSFTGGGAREGPGAPLRSSGHASLDASQRLGPNTLASLSVNTDFAETEVDARQVNLTRFPLFFPEKRTFFLEGSDIFDFGLGPSEDVIPFFSRRIGLFEGQQVPIDIGAKVNGRLGGSNFGVLAVRTRDVDTLATANTMAVVRMKQNVLRESSLGVIATAGDPLGRPGSWLAGPDLTYQTSHFRGDKNLLLGAWGLAVGRDGLSGDRTAAGVRAAYPNDLWDITLSYQRIGDGFDPSLGFVPRRGVHLASAWVAWQPRPKRPIGPLHIRQCFWENELTYVAGLSGRWQSYRYFMAPINCRLESGDRFEFNIVPTAEQLDQPFEVATGVTIPVGAYRYRRYRLEAGLATKRRFSAQATWWFGGFFDGDLDQYELTGAWKPSSLIILEFTGERNVGRLPAGRFVQDLVGTRLRLSVSPDLQITTFVQYDDDGDSFGSNTRLRWTFNPLGELFVVYNHNLRRPAATWAFDGNELLLKAQYAFRM
jgi:hypothetical protein